MLGMFLPEMGVCMSLRMSASLVMPAAADSWKQKNIGCFESCSCFYWNFRSYMFEFVFGHVKTIKFFAIQKHAIQNYLFQCLKKPSWIE